MAIDPTAASSTADSALGGLAAHRRTDFARRVYCLLGLPIDAVNHATALGTIGDAIETRRQLFFSTPNLNFLITSQSDVEFRNSVLHSDLAVADGMPLLWLAKLLRLPITERVAGSDLFAALLRGEAGSLSVYFFGGPEGVAQHACEMVNAGHGAARCVGCSSPGFGTLDEISAAPQLDAIKRTRPDFVVVALGGKKGQAWIERNRLWLAVPVISHLGAVINFTAGTVSRAPLFFQKSGLEWIWRIKEEPSLWRRYLGDGAALATLMVRHVLPTMAERRPTARMLRAHPPTARIDAVGQVLHLAGIWTDSALEPLRTALFELTQEESAITLDLGLVRALDGATLGLLLLLYGHQSERGLALAVRAPSRRVASSVRRQGAAYVLEGLVATARAPVDRRSHTR